MASTAITLIASLTFRINIKKTSNVQSVCLTVLPIHVLTLVPIKCATDYQCDPLRITDDFNGWLLNG